MSRLREWPESVVKQDTTRKLIEQYRAAFDADPLATFCAGELDGITIVLAVGAHGEQLQDFVRREWFGLIQTKRAS
jgi:hypothetical protein